MNVGPLVFYVPGRPRPQGSKTPGLTKDGRTFMRESGAAQLRPWRKAIRQAAADAVILQFGRGSSAPAFGSDPVSLVLTFGMRWPASHHGRRTWPTARPDVDKLVRAALDAITGPVVADDSQVVSLTARKVWAERDVDWPEGLHVWCNLVPGFVSALGSMPQPTTEGHR